MALIDIQRKPRSSGGKGGLFGSIAGGIAGAVGGAFAGPAGASAGASLGQAAGGAIGNAADPAKVSAPNRIELLRNDPEVQLSTLMDAQKDIAMSTDLDQGQKDQASGMVTNAMDILRRNLEIGRKRGLNGNY